MKRYEELVPPWDVVWVRQSESSGIYSSRPWDCPIKMLMADSTSVFSIQFLRRAGYWLAQSNIATNKICFIYLLQGYWHSLLQKIRNPRASVMDFTFQGILGRGTGEFLSEKSNLS